MTFSSSYDTIGKPVGRAEGPAKVTGAALYPADIKLPGTLVGKCLRSPYASARIVSIDTTEAKQLAGVHAVLTGADVPDTLVGRQVRDLPILAKEVVRFVGDKVAAVAAENIDIAEEALSRIAVQYDPLEANFDPLVAITEGATPVHCKVAEGISEEVEHPNIVAQKTFGKGNVKEGFARADFVFEHHFQTQHQHQGYMEPHANTLMIDEDGRVQVWLNSKMPFQVRQQLAVGLAMPEDQIRVNPTVIGGDFGGKGGFMDTFVAYHLAKHSNRPIRMVMNYTEELTAGAPRHPATMTFKTGVMKDGTIVARQANLIFNSGAYSGLRAMGGNVYYGLRCLGPYRIAHSKIDVKLVYTNLIPCASMRAPGDPQTFFGGEAQMDLIAKELGMSAWQFRRKNIVHDGDENPLGVTWEKVALPNILERCIEEADLTKARPHKVGKKVGRGMALCERPTGVGATTIKVSVNTQGKVTLETPLRDQGQGLYTFLRQVVGEELGVPYDEIELKTWDTDAVKFDGGVGGARVSNVGGNAAYEAAQKVKANLAGLAANKFNWPLEDIAFKAQQVVSGEAKISLAELVQAYGSTVAVTHDYEVPQSNPATVFTAQAAEVEIDTETGAIQLNQITSVHDVGTIINPISHQGQIDGSIMQGIGAALMEGLQFDEGQVINANLGDYKLPVMLDLPKIKTVHVQDENEGPIPYGGKAISEQAISGVAPAIVNAILDATDISMTELPVTAEAMLARLENHKEA